MAGVSLPLKENVLYKSPQTLDFDKIATFIGGNGSGKSTILKSIFDEKLKPASTLYDAYKVVCFSSGQNESYSSNFSDYLYSERSKKNALNLDCFFYDKLWSKLLIFLATTGNHAGLVRTFLKQNNYVSENEFDEDETTKLSFNVKVDKTYSIEVREAFEDEKKGNSDVITNKPYHRTLNNFINSLISKDYDFEEPLDEKMIELSQDSLSKVSFEDNDQASFDSKVMFFIQASDNDYFIIKDSFALTFKKGEHPLQLEDLSDGEYQLLFLYSLIDLFDSENTLFLFDEADSHLHYKNIEKLWEVYSSTQGLILTTTHLLDSISKAGLDRIKIIESGELKSADNALNLVERLETLSDIEAVFYKVVSMYKYVVVMDNVNDWELFKQLVFKKLATDTDKELKITEFFSNYICVGIPSSYNGTLNDQFADTKINWINNFCRFLFKSKGATKQAFLICDRDELSLASIDTKNSASMFRVNGLKVGSINPLKKCHVLSWWRREIKHYLLSKTALGEKVSGINELLPEACQLKVNQNGDIGNSSSFNDNLAIVTSKLVKSIVDPFICKDDKRFCVYASKKYIEKMPKEEISEDIVNMYKYLVGENE